MEDTVKNENTEKNYKTKKEFLKRYHKKSGIQEFWYRFSKNKLAVLGLFLFIIIIIIAAAAQLIADYKEVAVKINISNRLQAPSREHLFGTDEMGRDILARIFHGARTSLKIGFLSVAVSLLFGTIFGATAGYYGGRMDNIIMRFMDVFLCIPGILMALAIMASFGTSNTNLIMATGLSFTPKFSRIVRSAVMSVRGFDYVEAAKAIGANAPHIILHHIMINCIGPIIVQITLYTATAILNISALSFLGLGVQAPAPEWGNMLSSGRAYMRDYPYIVMAPGLAIFLTILSINLLGDGLRDALDPRLKQ